MSKKPLDQQIFDDPTPFEFFQAVRLIEKINPQLKTVGRDALPSEEAVRFRSHVSLNFPASEIQELRSVEIPGLERSIAEMHVNFMGMAGINGVLPVHYTETIVDRVRHRDRSMWEFLDIFTHRAVSLFYRAWAKYRFPLAYERGDESFTSYLFDLAGLGTDGLRGRMGVEDESLLPYTGLIGQKPHSAIALQNILSDYFGVNAKVEQFYGQWLDLTEEDHTKVGVQNSKLGYNSIIGTRIWEQQSKFRITLGPLTFAQFQAFLPVGTASRSAKSICEFMVGSEFDFDIKLSLKAKQVPSLVLTTRAIRKPHLGWTTWLKTKPFAKDDDQVVLQQAA